MGAHLLRCLDHEYCFYGGGHHILARYSFGEGFAYGVVGKQVAREVHPAQATQCSAPPGATPATALEHPLDLRSQPQVGIGNHKPGASEATLLLLRRSLRLEGAEELAPEALCLAVTHGDAEHLAVAEVIDADRYHHGP